MTPGPAAVAVEGLTKRFGSTLAVDDLSFSVAPGTVCGLLGPNGAGKTTTLRIILGLVHADAGSTSLLGEPMRDGHPVLRRVGTLVEGPAFVPHLSGTANLRLFWHAGGDTWPPPGLDDALDLAGLGPAVDRKVKTYSQGMRQRLAVAQALMGRPDLLVLDEPTNGLDPGEMREIRRLLMRLRDLGVTVLLSSHLLAEVEQVCSTVVVMNRGRLVVADDVDALVGAGSTRVVVNDPERAAGVLQGLVGVEITARDDSALTIAIHHGTRADVVEALVHAGIRIDSVVPRRHLEDAFLDLLGDGE